MRGQYVERDETLRADAEASGAAEDDASRVSPALPGDGRRALWGPSGGDVVFPFTSRITHATTTSLPGGGECSPRAGSAHGRVEWARGGRERARGFGLDAPVAAGGYRWTYLDAITEDCQWGIVAIALVGNPFSPGYARARRRPPARALDHSALNVAIYGPGGRLWVLSERVLERSHLTASSVRFGASELRWDASRLTVDLNDETAPFGRSVRGTIVFHPSGPPTDTDFSLDPAGLHRWWPVFPEGRVDVRLEQPDIRFTAKAYLDTNCGRAPLEEGFSCWTWSRAHDAEGTSVTYDVTTRSGTCSSIAVRFDQRGQVEELEGLGSSVLPTTRWRLARSARGDRECDARIVRELEDTPFYARSLAAMSVRKRPVVAVHETLSLDRFSATWVQFLLGFRMRRVSRDF